MSAPSVKFYTFIAEERKTRRRVFLKCSYDIYNDRVHVVVYPKKYRGVRSKSTRWWRYFTDVQNTSIGQWRKPIYK